MTKNDDDHHDDHPEHTHGPVDPRAIRADALEQLLTEQGMITSDTIDAILVQYEQDVGPMNGARVVARAWVDDAYRGRLLANGTAAIGELGLGGAQAAHLVQSPEGVLGREGLPGQEAVGRRRRPFSQREAQRDVLRDAGARDGLRGVEGEAGRVLGGLADEDAGDEAGDHADEQLDVQAE